MTFNIVPVLPIGSAFAEPVHSQATAGASNPGISLGDPDASRRIVAFIGNAADGGGVSALTIGGVSATQLAVAVNVLNVGYCFIAHVPSGLTGTVAITGSSASYRLGMYALYEASSNTPFDTQTFAGGGVLVDVPDRGVILAARFHISGAGTSWSGLDEDFDRIAGGGQAISGAHREFAAAETNHSVTASGGVSPSPVVIGVSFGT